MDAEPKIVKALCHDIQQLCAPSIQMMTIIPTMHAYVLRPMLLLVQTCSCMCVCCDFKGGRPRDQIDWGGATDTNHKIY